jgi:hypothetical protein
MGFHLSSSLDPEAVFSGFSQHECAHIPNVLPSENANPIHKGLTGKTPWSLAFNDRDKHIDVSATQLANMPKQTVNQLQHAIYARARDNFQYCYSSYPIYDAHAAGLNPGHVLHQFYEWMNGEEFLAFARVATGFADISSSTRRRRVICRAISCPRTMTRSKGKIAAQRTSSISRRSGASTGAGIFSCSTTRAMFAGD